MDPYLEFESLVEDIIKEEELNISAIVGAGLSAGSGLETFRGTDGMYQDKDPMELASRRGFKNNPELVWTWYRDRIAKVFETEPNAGHHALVQLEEMDLLNLIITQNVDGLHLQAGQSEDKLIEIHGTLSRTHCLQNCGRSYVLDEIPTDVPVECECGSYQRPSVVWFGEGIRINIYDVLDQISTKSNLLLVIGTSGTVMPVARFPYVLAQDMKIININPDLSSFKDITDIGFADGAEIVLPKLLDIISRLVES